MATMGYEAVIGLEVHAQLLTDSKLFCKCSTKFGADPNDHTCPICLGMPGVLPVLNDKAVDMAIKFGLAIDNNPRGTSVFARKNYFYPDLPKGYQITQFEQPVVGRGSITIELEDGTTKVIGVTRAHLEEDAGQSVHDGMPQSRSKSYVNLNRAGVPLLEIVSEPEIHSPEEAYAYLTELKAIVQYLGINDGNMEEGSLRCDANVSVRPIGQKKLGTRTELKNLNSFNNVRRAIQHEIDRQVTTITQGGEIEQCTLLWDAEAQTSRVMRTKEDSHDYRYFPEPDLPPVFVSDERVAGHEATMPELPRQKRERFINEYGIPKNDVRLLVSDKELGFYFEEAAHTSNNPKATANWIMTELLRLLNDSGDDLADCKIAPKQLGDLIKAIDSKVISGKIGKAIIKEMFATGKDPDAIIEEKGLKQITDTGALEAVVQGVLDRCPDQVAQYREGKTKVFGFLVGQCMKETRGKGNPGVVNDLLKKLLEA